MSKTKKTLLIIVSFCITLIIVAGLSIVFSFAFPRPYSTILSAIAGVAAGWIQSICFGHLVED